MKTTRQIPMIILAFILSALLLLSESEERCGSGSQERYSRKRCPQRHICAVTCFRDVRHRLELVIELGHDRLLSVYRNSHVRRKDIRLVRFVRHLGDNVLADPETFDFDLSVLIGHILLRERVAGDVGSCDSKGESGKHAVLRSLFDPDAAGLSQIDKAVSGLILNDNSNAILLDGEAVGFLIEIEK